jgi:hypothetical protein
MPSRRIERVFFCPKCKGLYTSEQGKCTSCSRNKHNARRVTLDGYAFASQREANRYVELCQMQDAGLIRDLVVHPAFLLVVNGVRIGRYTADFRYYDVGAGRVVVEDVKGGKSTRTEAYGLRKKLMLALYGIEITEVE